MSLPLYSSGAMYIGVPHVVMARSPREASSTRDTPKSPSCTRNLEAAAPIADVERAAGGMAAGADEQGLTLVHYSAQLEPRLTQE